MVPQSMIVDLRLISTFGIWNFEFSCSFSGCFDYNTYIQSPVSTASSNSQQRQDMNVVKEIERINAAELEHGIHGGMGGSWHDKYRDSAWVYIGGLSFDLTEGDIICFMSQWGEVEDINLIRDKSTNKSLGFCFLKYEDQRSTILAVDNFNGIKLLGKQGSLI